MIKYKINVIEELKKRNISTYRIKQNKLLSGAVVKKLYNNDTSISLATLDTLCALLHCQISDIIEYIPDDFKSFDEFANGVYNSNSEN